MKRVLFFCFCLKVLSFFSILRKSGRTEKRNKSRPNSKNDSAFTDSENFFVVLDGKSVKLLRFGASCSIANAKFLWEEKINMAYQNAYSAYQKNNVSTASQGRLVVLLYEGAVKHLTAAKNLFGPENKLKPNQIEQFGIHIQKTQAIITELQVSLDMEKGGEIAKNLMSLYLFFNEELMSANINQDKEKISSVLKMMSDLADAWRTIANSTANAPATKVPNAVNIVG